jgi:hypothetical protein
VPSCKVRGKLPVKPLGRLVVLGVPAIPYREVASPTVVPEGVVGVAVICGLTVPVTVPALLTAKDSRRLKSNVSPLAVLAVTTRAGLMVMVNDVAVRVAGIDTAVGGLVRVFRVINCGLVSVTFNWLYVPGGTPLELVRMLVKSVKRAKSTVAGDVAVISGTDCPPDCGVRLAEVMVAEKDSTSQIGASVPKVTTDPSTPPRPPPPVPDPHPTIRAAAKTAATAGMNSLFLLLI